MKLGSTRSTQKMPVHAKNTMKIEHTLGILGGKNITEHHGTTILETRVSLFGYLLLFVCDMGQTWVPLKMSMDGGYDTQ